ncbi:MAG: FAD-binding protein [Alphaproteobacteria bacterium]|nr:FAD-binding protein [Alphaproteobacteria bacterium]
MAIPRDADDVCQILADAANTGTPLEVVGRGTKRGLGRPMQTASSLDLSGLTGVSLYEPEELVMTAAAGTPLAEIERTLAEKNQRLAFEPMDLGPIYGEPENAASIGGVFAANLSGPGRLRHGAARDHLLGFKAVNGRGEFFKSGSRVVKNVTGYDLSKVICGSHGTLAAMTEVTFKVMPAPEKTRTVLIFGLDDVRATEAMSAALGSPHEVIAAAHLPASIAARSSVSYVSGAGRGVTAIRVEGPAPSAEHRCKALREELARFGATEELHGMNSAKLWREIRDARPFIGDPRPLWRLSVAPTEGPKVIARIARALQGEWFYDWGGGLVWLALPVSDDAGTRIVRGAIEGGHATLIRADASARAAVSVFQPQPGPLAALAKRVKEGFDPGGILNPGRMD